MTESASKTGPQGFENIEAQVMGDRPFLGDPGAVEQIVRAFCQEVNEANLAFEQGKASGPETQAAIGEAVRRCADIFEGKDAAYATIRGFHAPDALGAAILARMGYDSAPEDACEQLLWQTGGIIISVSDALARGDMADGDAQFQIEAAIEEATSALLGLPPGMNVSGPSED